MDEHVKITVEPGKPVHSPYCSTSITEQSTVSSQLHHDCYLLQRRLVHHTERITELIEAKKLSSQQPRTLSTPALQQAALEEAYNLRKSNAPSISTCGLPPWKQKLVKQFKS
jgi:hypothetical protein